MSGFETLKVVRHEKKFLVVYASQEIGLSYDGTSQPKFDKGNEWNCLKFILANYKFLSFTSTENIVNL